jgi:hypothetical protein
MGVETNSDFLISMQSAMEEEYLAQRSPGEELKNSHISRGSKCRIDIAYAIVETVDKFPANMHRNRAQTRGMPDRRKDGQP